MKVPTYNRPEITISNGDTMLLHLLLSTLLLLPPSASADEKPAPVWGYMGGGNDDEGWGSLATDYALCDTGQNQSPVGIGDTTQSTMLPLKFHYHSAPMTIVKKDRTIVISMETAGTLVDEGHSYTLQEMRIHTPAEHEVIGKLYPAELQLIHRDDQGHVLILAIFVERTPAENATLKKILDTAPRRTQVSIPVSFDPGSLLPESHGYYAYSGSLSWPPCTEGVEWRILKDAISMSQDQMIALGKLLGRNARQLQPLYFRKIKESIH